MEVEENILTEKDGKTSAKGTGKRHSLDVDTVIFAIGDQVDANFGLPAQWGEFEKSREPKFPMEGLSYETTTEGVFVGGWARKASEGLVGYARRDGTNAAKAVLQYLQTKSPAGASAEAVTESVRSLRKPVISKDDLKRLETAEAEEAKKRGLDFFKFASNEEMLHAMGLIETA